MDYLHRRGKYQHLSDARMPGMILLDLNMPRMDGREALEQIKADPRLRRIPTVILTTLQGGGRGYHPRLWIGRQLLHRQTSHVQISGGFDARVFPVLV